MKTKSNGRAPGVRWPTVAVGAICYGGVAVSTAYADDLGGVVACVLLTLSLTLYSSFHHEVLHGHPFRNAGWNTVLVFPAMGLMIPYPRFRDTHLAHHHDPSLTDPYDDPETNFIDPAVWAEWSSARRWLYDWNNTLLGRMVIGPAIGMATFYKQDLRAALAGDRRIIAAYAFHAAGLVPVALWLAQVSTMPFWLYALSVYFSLSILKIRTFLEHRAHEKARCRTVIIEDRGLLALLFLNNNLHAVHHACPSLPWYELRAYYRARRDRFLHRNEGYAYRSYAQIARLYLFNAKDPVPHSLWPTVAPKAEKPARASKRLAS